MDNEMEKGTETAGMPEPAEARTPEMQTAMPEEKHSGNDPIGPAIGTIIIVIILIIGGLYLWGAKLSKESALEEKSAEEILNTPDTQLESLEIKQSSDEIRAIEEDLNATDLNNLDAELKNIEAELNI